jgi:hypothetical protein
VLSQQSYNLLAASYQRCYEPHEQGVLCCQVSAPRQTDGSHTWPEDCPSAYVATMGSGAGRYFSGGPNSPRRASIWAARNRAGSLTS